MIAEKPRRKKEKTTISKAVQEKENELAKEEKEEMN